ncbi:DUF4870 domain-containing protein [Dokdonia sinensis]|uniref:DUF4870 domain-containing protein n=1 Tax=Dokdonia sinensis TaxID=2479847 RepID=A0A3M0H2P1_9FLAO|nr:DUF4870 domain-containing protein [Dokdonia sinensis]RMB63916.1 DUF4870 domain-containing protein [Dokdonia sinensis]
METTVETHHKNVSTFIHLSTFCKWIFPFGNFIAPLILWTVQGKRSRFIDNHGKNAINFQLSMFLYLIGIAVLTIPFIIYQAFRLEGTNSHFYFNPEPHINGDLDQLSALIIVLLVAGTIAIGLFILEVITVISAAIAASEGKAYKYPLTIPFLKETLIKEEPLATDKPLEDEIENKDDDKDETIIL